MAKTAGQLKGIAQAAGFSVNMGSLALRGGLRIPVETRRQISEIIAKMNDLPNQVAKALVMTETRTIGLILSELTKPVLTALAQWVEMELSTRGHTTLFATSNKRIDRENSMADAFRARHSYGMLIFPCNHKQIDHIRTLRARNDPVVLPMGDSDAGVDAVCMDERAAVPSHPS